ncbi:MAG: putative Tic20 family protein [Chitinophagales bacterium]|jgi:uncharacterized Tic20 family protein
MKNLLPTPDSDERNWAVLCHLSSLLAMITLGAGIIAPTVLWLVKKDESEFINDQGKGALNFSISVLMAWIVCIPFTFIVIGFAMMGIVLVTWFVFAIIAALAASRGEHYRYPFSLRLIS